MKKRIIISVIIATLFLLVLAAVHVGTRENVTIEVGTFYSEGKGVDYLVSTQQMSVTYLSDADIVDFPEGKPTSGTLVRCTITYQYFVYFPLNGRYTVTIIPEN